MPRFAASLVLALGVLLTGGGPALASYPPETVALDPIVFTDVNPCTGQTHLVTLTMTLRSHDFELSDADRHHGTSTLAGTITTSSGFAGRIDQVLVDNGAGPFDSEGSPTIVTVVTNAVARNDAGEAFSVHLTFHLTFLDGDAVVVVDRLRSDCLG